LHLELLTNCAGTQEEGNHQEDRNQKGYYHQEDCNQKGRNQEDIIQKARHQKARCKKGKGRSRGGTQGISNFVFVSSLYLI
jgi:hypothetical protein